MARRHWYHYAIALAIMAAGWEALALSLHTPAFPRLAEATRAFVEAFSGGPGLQHFYTSLYRVTLSTVISLVVGIPWGLYLGRSGGPIGNVLVYLLHPIPKVVFLPVIIVVMGIGDTSKIFLITLVILFQVVVTVRDAAAGVGQGLIRSVKSLGGSEWHIFRHVILPASLPGIFTALRLVTGTAVAVLFFAETYATKYGLGSLVWDAWSMRQYGLMFAGVMAMALMGFGFYVLLDWAERVICPWADSQR
ncbi:MAG: transporter permease protein [Symbiobacteriaceae bacterium]|jgi:NitT/TauT family transport system permease protein|nr:transporter permease protein [Symbiobacteriaceae bacterium]